MKKIIFSIVGMLFFVAAVHAQAGKQKPAVTKPLLANINDSASYAVGLSVANFYKQQGITKLNTTLVSKAINDVFSNKKTLFDDFRHKNQEPRPNLTGARFCNRKF